MFCKNCGNQLPEGAVFCGSCGTKVEVQAAPQQPAYDIPQQPAYEAPQTSYTIPQADPVTAPVRPQEDPELNSLAKNTMIMGIVGLALSEFGLPGLIVSCIASKKAAEFVSKAGSLYGKAKVGRALAKAGKIVGIIMTILWAFIILVYGILGIMLAAGM